MLPIIAWRNVWRNKLRSLTVVISIFLGIWAGIFVVGLSVGMNNQRIQNFISTSISHIQVHNPEYLKENKLQYFIEEDGNLTDYLKSKDSYAFSRRLSVSGMVASSNGTKGVMLSGITPEKEKQVSVINENLVEGDYLNSDRKNQLVIGKKLAEDLKVKIGSKVVLTFQDIESEIVSAAFRIVGIYKTANGRFDERNVFAKKEDLGKLIGNQQAFHEVAIYLNDDEKVDEVAAALASEFPGLKVRTWKEIAPDLRYADEIMTQFLYIIMVIIMLALAFGIVNTMLMAILERKRELGMLMAVGMNKMRLFSMIVFETVYLCLVSGPLGVIAGYLTIEYFKSNGLDLSVVAQGLEDFGYSPVVYTEVEGSFYFVCLVMVVATALLASLYPAYKALKLKPVDAIRGL